MALIKKNESFPERPVIVVIYGTPGVGKTSVCNTANNPVLIDCDRGSDRACNRAEGTLLAAKWADVLADEKEIKSFNTCVIDTAKAVLDDYLMVHVTEKDYKLKNNKLKAYGAIGDEFKDFTNRRRAEGIDIVIIAHSKEEKDGDNIKVSPDVTGQSKDLILRIADQVGFITMVNGKRTINFEPTDRTIGKNVARIPSVAIPDEKDPAFPTFMADIIATVKSSIRKQSEDQIKAQAKLAEIQQKIADCAFVEELTGLFELVADFSKTEKTAVWKLVQKRADELGFKYDTTTKTFVEK